MGFSKPVRDQLKKLTAEDLINSLLKDGWKRENKRGAIQRFYHPHRDNG